MVLLKVFLPIIMSLTFLLIVIMLPVYFIRKHKNPDDKKNTLKRLILLSLIAATIMTMVMGAGLIAMFFDDLFVGI